MKIKWVEKLPTYKIIFRLRIIKLTNSVTSLFWQYRFFGEPVVKAAVANSCHHLDVSGEPEVS